MKTKTDPDLRKDLFQILDTGCWILDTGYWMLDAGYWILDAGCWILDTGCVCKRIMNFEF
ncbi:MAG: hypothetical protein K8R63_10185 [Bacteroidales bacterium]|nr:hypothetical protein [Bacteroidales bacterium]